MLDNLQDRIVLNITEMNLLDGVKSADIKITKEVRALSDMVKDNGLSIVDRIESFEDIMNIEIGDTSLKRARSES